MQILRSDITMKKISALLSVVLMLLSFCPSTAFAEEIVTDRYVEYFDDGSYIVTEIETSNISVLSSSTVTNIKTSSYYDSDNVKNWTVKLTGTFSYTGSSASCTKSTVNYTIYNDYWKVTSAAASKSGNKATGNFTVKKYILGIPTKTVNRTLTITCSNSGVCS